MHATLRDPEPPLTRSVEDYLKAIYHLSSQGGFAATSDIAALLEVAPPSVSGMVKRLSETGLIEHVPYRGVQLTAQGRRAALRMIRRHRVLEVYLSQQLGYDWDGVHTEAERLEHAVSDELIERMAKALGDPQYDPHGAPIPTAAGEIEEAELVPLADATIGAVIEVRQVADEDAARLRYLAEQGLTPGRLLMVSERQPGNWATDLAGGSAFGYSLLSVILISNLMAILLQGLAAKLGIVTGRDLAQACRDHYSRPTSIALWVLCEVAIAACDLAEVIGSAIALNLLFGIPLPWGIAITALDVLLVLLLQHKGFRLLEALVVTLIATIAGCFIFEILISRPGLVDVATGFVPGPSILRDPGKLYIAIGILGATVIPHNLYLHSSIVQTRRYDETAAGKREAVRYAFLDSTIALTFALFINAAILIVAAATFHRAGQHEVAEIQEAYRLLTPLLGVVGASAVFAFALLASGRKPQ